MANKITYANKVGLTPKETHVNQVWDDDMNEIKDKHNLNDDRITSIEGDLGDGVIESGNTETVTGGSVYDGISEASAKNILFRGFLNSDGKTVNSPTSLVYVHTQYLLAVEGLHIYRARSFSGASFIYGWFYDDNFDVVGTLTAGSDANQEVTLTSGDIPSGAVYVRFHALYSEFKYTKLATTYKTIPDELLSITGDISENQTTLKSLMIQGGFLEEDGKTVNSSTSTTLLHTQYLLAVEGLNIYRARSFGSAGLIYAWFYDADFNVVGTLTTASEQNIEIILTSGNIPAGAVYVRANILKSTFETYANIEITQIGLADDFDILTPPTIYGREITDSDSFLRFNNSLYPEGFVKDGGKKLTINGGREFTPNAVDKSDQFTQEIILQDENGKVKGLDITVKNTSPDDVTGVAHVLCIGESTTEADTSSPFTKQKEGFWNWSSAMRYYSLIDQEDSVGADVKLIGRKGLDTSQFDYKGQTLETKGVHEGFSGWPSYSFLHWPSQAKLSTSSTRFYAETMWYGAGLYTKTPYNQGSYNPATEPYTASDAQKTLLTETPLGKYKVDGSNDLWVLVQYLGTQSGYPTFSNSDPYDGSAPQIAELQAWFDSLCADPINPFYSLTEARTGTTGTAFDLDVYLTRYRTCDDLGVALTGNAGETVTGSDGLTYTIGTDIVSTSDYDVYTPTHIILNVGINDSEGGNDVDNTVANIQTLVGLFSVPTAYFITRYPGVSNVGSWSDVAVARQFPPNTYCVDAIEGLTSWFDSQVDKYLLASYHIQYPASVEEDFAEGVYAYNTNRVNCSRNNVHLGWQGHQSVGFQCISWIYHTLE